MAAPTIRPYNGVVPKRSQAPSEFANNADDWVAYQAPLAADYNALGDYVDDEAATIEGLADDAATSETNAATSATNASTSESNASTSETNAATSASNASTSETNAATSATNAANSFDSFDDRYLGAKTSDPTVDNDGDALLTGALYFNSDTDNMRVYLGSAWANIADLTGSVDINGGTIDGTAIGETTKSTGKFTALESDTLGTGVITATADAVVNGLTVGRGLGGSSLSTATGRLALSSNTTGVANTASGSGSLESNTTGSNNTASGRDALRANTTGAVNTALGTSSLFRNTTGSSNTASGVSALQNNTTGNFNTAIGTDALLNNTTGNDNTASGVRTLKNNTTGSSSTAIGVDALFNNTTGILNDALGVSALQNNTTGICNTALGVSALQSNTTGSGNTAINPRSASNSFSPVFNPTTENNRFCMGSTSVTNAYIQVAWTVVSDERDKAEFAPVPHGLDFVNKLCPIAYRYKMNREDEVGHGPVRYGFPASQVLGLEGDNPVIVDNEDSEKLRMVETSLIPVLVNAINELTARVAFLEGK